jgi:hypothetical protein
MRSGSEQWVTGAEVTSWFQVVARHIFWHVRCILPHMDTPAPRRPALRGKHLLFFGAIGFARLAHAEESETDTYRHYPRPTLLWAGLQLLPSPQVSFAKDASAIGALKWQLTPISYSFGVHRRISPWRSFVVDPFARYGGSMELYGSPILFLSDARAADRFGLQAGMKAYVPILEHGETLSAGFGASYLHALGKNGVSYDAGLYFLYGIVGIEASYSPSIAPMTLSTTLRIRYL